MAIDIKAVAQEFTTLPFLQEGFELDALLEKVKEKGKDAESRIINRDWLHAVLKDMGIEKVIEEAKGDADGDADAGDGDAAADDAGDAAADDSKGDDADADGKGAEDEEGKEAAAAPKPEPKMTDFAGELFAVVDPGKTGEINLADLLAILQVGLKGYGEACLKFCLSACDLKDSGNVNEAELFSSIRWSASKDLSPIVMNHLRKLWRGLEKAGEGEGVTVQIEQFFEKLGEDDVLGQVLMQDVQIEVKRPGDEDADAADE